nr:MULTISPECIES: alkaline phosphatase family protein [unclassified Paenibacillus]
MDKTKGVTPFEKFAARAWNFLNEGKPFLPIFTVGAFFLYHLPDWGGLPFWGNALFSLALVLPILLLYMIYDFPLYLRNYLWIPVVAALLAYGRESLDLRLAGFALALYTFFTVFFWGTIYYHLRIGTPWNNFARFWKLVLKHSDSTSGNAQEQIPKFLLLLGLWEMLYGKMTTEYWSWSVNGGTLFALYAGIAVFAWVLHRYLFDWKPKEYDWFTRDNFEAPASPHAKKVYVIVIDGMRKERFYEAKTPFLDKLRMEGTEYTQMETIYPARTVVCFSSMHTGAYPREHGIASNLVLRYGVKTESVFDALRRAGRKGRLLGIAHLIDAFGDDVESITAVMNNDEADRHIIERAKKIVSEQDPDFLTVQLIGTDQTGHSRGVFYDDYIQKIEEADALIEEFVGWLDERGKLEDAVLIFCADHGQADGIGGHGHLDDGERYVPFFVWGQGVAKGKRVDRKHSLVSLASTVTYLLGAPFPSHAHGPVLTEPFEKESGQ